MAWVKVPLEHHPIFSAALPKDPRVETRQMFGGVAASLNGHIFAGLFARSVMIWLDDAERAEALALEGAGYFDPMGEGGPRRSDKVMLPEAMMEDPAELRSWISRAFAATAKRPPKPLKPKKAAAKKSLAKKPVAKKPVAKKPMAKKPVAKKRGGR